MPRVKLARPVLLAAASLLAACATTGASSGRSGGARLTFVARPTKVGDVDAFTWAIHSHVRLVMSGVGKTDMVHTADNQLMQRITTTVVAMNRGAVTAERLHFDEYTMRLVQDGTAGGPGPSPVAGKTYLARLVNGKIELTHADGSALSGAEAKVVSDEVPTLGVVDPVPAFLAAHTFEKGVPVRLPDAAVRSLLHMRETDHVGPEGMTLVLEKVGPAKGQRVATFSTTLTLVSPGASGGQSTARMKGTLSLDPASGRLVASHLTGSVETRSSVQIGPKTLVIKGTGSVTTTRTDDYR